MDRLVRYQVSYYRQRAGVSVTSKVSQVPPGSLTGYVPNPPPFRSPNAPDSPERYYFKILITRAGLKLFNQRVRANRFRISK